MAAPIKAVLIFYTSLFSNLDIILNFHPILTHLHQNAQFFKILHLRYPYILDLHCFPFNEKQLFPFYFVFSDYSFTFTTHQGISESCFTLKGKKTLSFKGNSFPFTFIFFLLERTVFQKGDKTILTELPPLKVYLFTLRKYANEWIKFFLIKTKNIIIHALTHASWQHF